MSTEWPNRVLTVGGRGRTGRRVAARLHLRDLRVRIASRHSSTSENPGVEQVVADLAAPGAELLDGVDGVVVSVEPPSDAAGADAVLNRGVALLAALAAEAHVPVVLVSQIYITRAETHPDMRDVIAARGRGEAALRRSGAPCAIVRPGWLHDGPMAGARVEQGDTGDGRVSRDTVADAVVAALLDPAIRSRTFELFDAQPAQVGDVDWRQQLLELRPDRPERQDTVAR